MEDGKPLATIYRQFDGYPEGRGKELAKFLAGMKIVNGYSSAMAGGTHANGVGCLAAQWVATEKNSIGTTAGVKSGSLGNVYIYPLTAIPNPDDTWIAYFYRVHTTKTGLLRVKVWECSGDEELIFSGSPKAMLDWIDNLECTANVDADGTP
jgi:hypothetical protein